jgi:hypothetical protein
MVVGGALPFYDSQPIKERGHYRARGLDSRKEIGRRLLESFAYTPNPGLLGMDVGKDAKNSEALQRARRKGIHVEAGVVVTPGGRTASNFGGTEASKSGR